MTTPDALQNVPNEDLLSRLKALVGRSNQLTAHVLAHLAEVEARGIYRELACSSLYAYCVYELRKSEDEAQRRILAARAARRFPLLLEMLESAAIHLTGIVLLAPHLTDDNHEELLARARYRSKREIQRLIAEVAPKPDVPAKVEPLGPQGRSGGRATWAAFAESLAGGVRDLPPGTGPGQAPSVAKSSAADALLVCGAASPGGAGAADVDSGPELASGAGPGHASGAGLEDASGAGPAGGSHAPARGAAPGTMSDGLGGHAVSTRGGAPRSGESPLRYKVQFTATDHHVRLLEEARDLLQHVVTDRDIARVHELAMEALVEKLRKRRCCAKHESDVASDPPGGANGAPERAGRQATETQSAKPTTQAASEGATEDAANATETQSAKPTTEGASTTRHIPAAVRREVWKRDRGQCAFVDARGQRCRERSGLELHHHDAYFRGGVHSAENLSLYCRAHNALMAERELGDDYMRRRIEERRRGSVVLRP